MIYITNSPAETEAIGAALGRILPAGTVIEQSVPGGTSVMVSATKVSLVVSGGPHYK